jgi:hypothetical protein
MSSVTVRVAAIVVASIVVSGSVMAADEIVSIPIVHFVDKKPTYDYLRPIPIGVHADDVRDLPALQVRVFANRNAELAKKQRVGETPNGCWILHSRVEPYTPTFENPDILLLESIQPEDFRCTNGEPRETPFVVVVESAANGQDSLLRIRPDKIDRYFANSLFFVVRPPPGFQCPRAQPPHVRTRRTAPSEEEKAVADIDTSVRNLTCIGRVEELKRVH